MIICLTNRFYVAPYNIYVVKCISCTYLGTRHISPAMHKHTQVKYTLFSFHFEQLEVDWGILFKTSISNFIKIVPMGAELFYGSDGGIDMSKFKIRLFLIWQRRSRLDLCGSYQASVVCLVYKLTTHPFSWNTGVIGYLRNFSLSGRTLLCRVTALK
jgi:hypothetical protein